MINSLSWLEENEISIELIKTLANDWAGEVFDMSVVR